ncbi:MAG TPA: hypothetical protein VIL33_05040 [Rhodothermia bacterium]
MSRFLDDAHAALKSVVGELAPQRALVYSEEAIFGIPLDAEVRGFGQGGTPTARRSVLESRGAGAFIGMRSVTANGDAVPLGGSRIGPRGAQSVGPGRTMNRCLKSPSRVNASWIPRASMTTKLRQSTGL